MKQFVIFFSILFMLMNFTQIMGENIEIDISGQPATLSFIKEEVTKALKTYKIDSDTLKNLNFPSFLSPGESWCVSIPSAGENRSENLKLKVNNVYIPSIPFEYIALSNSPEKIKNPGLLFNSGLTRYKPVRLRVYHLLEKDSSPLFLGVYIYNPENKPARVHLMGATGGPSKDWMQAGHLNNLKYMTKKEKKMGRFFDVPGKEMVPLEVVQLNPSEVISGNYDLLLTNGGPVQILVVAKENEKDKPEFFIESDKQDTHSRGAYPLTSIETESVYYVGANNPLYFNMGNTPISDIFKGKSNKGNYGVVYSYKITLINPYKQKKAVSISFQPRGGSATATFNLNNQIISVATTRAYDLVQLSRIWIEPESRKVLSVETMPEDASNYPIRLLIMDN
jgi:hypothetical protein